MTNADINALYDDRATPDSRAVLEDLAHDRGERVTRLGSALSFIDAADAAAADADDDDADDDDDAADDDADADAADAAAADAADDDDDDDAAADAAAADAADAADADDADAAADDDDDDDDDAARKRFGNIANNLFGDIDVTNGLKLLRLPGRYYLVTRIGYLQRIGGDEYMLMPGARTVRRTSGARNLDDLAADGPKKDHTLSPASRMGELIHRLVIKRAFEANVEAWADHVKPPTVR